MTGPAGPRRRESRSGADGGKRNPGKQPGAPGSHLAWSENPGQAVPHFPRRACGCGADLAAAADLGVAAWHREIEIPQMDAAVIRHDLNEVACRCGRVHRAAAPARGRRSGHGELWDQPAGLVGVPDGRGCYPGAPGRGADRRPALARLHDVRPVKTQQKISGRLRCEDVTRRRYAIGGWTSAAARHGADLLAAPRDALAGKPWMPPIRGNA